MHDGYEPTWTKGGSKRVVYAWFSTKKRLVQLLNHGHHNIGCNTQTHTNRCLLDWLTNRGHHNVSSHSNAINGNSQVVLQIIRSLPNWFQLRATKQHISHSQIPGTLSDLHPAIQSATMRQYFTYPSPWSDGWHCMAGRSTGNNHLWWCMDLVHSKVQSQTISHKYHDIGRY